MSDGSVNDTRTQDQRIASGDSPKGSSAYVGPSGNRIDVRAGIDVGQVEMTLRREAAKRKLDYHFSDLEGVLRNTGYDKGLSLDAVIEKQVAIYEKRAAD